MQDKLNAMKSYEKSPKPEIKKQERAFLKRKLLFLVRVFSFVICFWPGWVCQALRLPCTLLLGSGHGAGRAVRLEMPDLFKKRDEVDPCDKDDSCILAIGSFNVQGTFQISKYAYSWQIRFLNKNKTPKSCLIWSINLRQLYVVLRDLLQETACWAPWLIPAIWERGASVTLYV